MAKVKQVYLADTMVNIIDYVRKRIQKTANLEDLPSYPKTTRLMARECILDGNIIIFQIPNGNSFKMRQKLRQL